MGYGYDEVRLGEQGHEGGEQLKKTQVTPKKGKLRQIEALPSSPQKVLTCDTNSRASPPHTHPRGDQKQHNKATPISPSHLTKRRQSDKDSQRPTPVRLAPISHSPRTREPKPRIAEPQPTQPHHHHPVFNQDITLTKQKTKPN